MRPTRPTTRSPPPTCRACATRSRRRRAPARRRKATVAAASCSTCRTARCPRPRAAPTASESDGLAPSGEQPVAGSVLARDLHAALLDERAQQPVHRLHDVGVAVDLERPVPLDLAHAVLLDVAGDDARERAAQ